MLTGRDEVVEGVEGVEEGVGGGGGDDPVWGCLFDVVGGDVLADGDAVPAEAVDEVGWHDGGSAGCWVELAAEIEVRVVEDVES